VSSKHLCNGIILAHLKWLPMLIVFAPWTSVRAATVQNGSGYAWGSNSSGQVGDGTTTNRTSPVPVLNMATGVSAVACGGSSCYAVQNGALYAWGSNNSTQLGDGTNTTRLTPVPINALSGGVSFIAGGNDHALALQNGAAYAWGSNLFGQLGVGTTRDSRSTPTPVVGLSSGVTAIAAGSSLSVAIQNGGAYAWGFNLFGQIGDGTTQERDSPVAVSGLGANVSAVAASDGFALAIQSGQVYAWGLNSRGQLGDGTTIDHHTPELLASLGTGVTAIATGEDHALALVNGQVYAWGSESNGQLGNGISNSNFFRTTPALVSGLNNITDIAAGLYSSFALGSDGSLWDWGYDASGQLGLGDTFDRSFPAHLLPPSGFRFASIDVDASDSHTVATIVPLPEPSGLWLLPLGSLALIFRCRLQRRRSSRPSQNGF